MTATIESFQSPESDFMSWHKRLRWDQNVMRDLRSRLTAHVCMLQMFCSTWGQLAVLDGLEVYRAEVKAGRKKTPSASSLSKASEAGQSGPNDEWAEIISPLEGLGITAAMAIAHKDMILAFFTTNFVIGDVGDAAGSEAGNELPSETMAGTTATWLTAQGDQEATMNESLGVHPSSSASEVHDSSNVSVGPDSASDSADHVEEPITPTTCGSGLLSAPATPLLHGLAPLLTEQQSRMLLTKLWEAANPEGATNTSTQQAALHEDMLPCIRPVPFSQEADEGDGKHSSLPTGYRVSSQTYRTHVDPSDLEKGIFFSEKDLRPVQKGMEYDNLVTSAVSDETCLLYRRFGYLHSRTLLEKQDELRVLEQQLDALDKSDMYLNSDALYTRACQGQQRKLLLVTIEERLRDYCE